MPLNLHPECKVRLLQTLATAITQLYVENGKFISRLDALPALESPEKVLPVKGELRSQLSLYIDNDRPLTEFVLDTLSEELSHLPFNDIERQPLTEIDGYKESAVVAQRLVEGLISLPQQYTLSFKLPTELSTMLGDQSIIVISSRLRLVRATEEIVSEYPPSKSEAKQLGALSGLLGGLSGWLSAVHWEKDGIYLQVDAEGFIGPYGGSQPHLEAIRTLRAFSGLGLALGLFDFSSAYLPQSPPSDILLHRRAFGGEFVAVRTISLDDGISRTIKRLRLSSFIESLSDQKRRSQFIIGAFFLIQAALSGGKKADLIFLASQWFFDGHSHGSDQLLKFVQTMIVLEILLGDKASADQTGLNVLLRNRCAYLIGTSQEDRAEVLEWFRKIYDVRSEIVHTGKHSLSTSELELFARLRWICRRVIRKEIELLRADQGKGQ